MQRTKNSDELAVQSEIMAGDNDILLGNVFFAFLFKKTERLGSAVHLVSASIAEGAPIKDSLRLNSLGLLRILTRLSAGNEDRSVVFREFLCQIEEMISLLSIASSAHVMAVENAQIIEQEYRKVASLMLEKSDEVVGERIAFAQNYFEVPRDEHMHERAPLSYAAFGAIQGHEAAERADMSHRGASARGSLPKLAVSQDRARLLSPRRAQVLKVVDNKGKVSVKDVSSQVKGCSEKTIQRELVALVSEGVLKREGERRWSLYSRV